MSQNKYIHSMISSRNNSEFDGESLSVIRAQLKEMIEKEKLFGRELFKVWINEDNPPLDTTQTTWKQCLNESKEKDIVIVLYNGESGWTVDEDDTIGICHAEMLEAMNSSMEKVYLIDISNNYVGSEPKDSKFKEFIDESQIWKTSASNQNELKEEIYKTMTELIYSQIKRGLRSASKATNLGQHLVWKRMNYDVRSNKIKNSIKSVSRFVALDDGYLEYEDNGQKLLFKIHAIPDSVSISAAKEKVGQPFLNDFMMKEKLNDRAGPIHIIGCYKTITEAQVRKIMGFPDVILIKDEFGIYVADKIYKIQMVFLEKCVGESETIHAVERFFDWLYRSGESEFFIKRACDRKEIVEKIAEKMEE